MVLLAMVTGPVALSIVSPVVVKTPGAAVVVLTLALSSAMAAPVIEIEPTDAALTSADVDMMVGAESVNRPICIVPLAALSATLPPLAALPTPWLASDRIDEPPLTSIANPPVGSVPFAVRVMLPALPVVLANML